MVILAIDNDQVLALVAQLPSERKVWLLRALASEQWPEWAKLAEYASKRVRATAVARGADWDAMSELERESFIDQIVHEA